MTAATYVAELLLWSSVNLIWEISLGCALIFAWRTRSKPPAAQRHAVAIAMLGSLPVLLTANAVIAHTSLVANAREGSLGALDAHAHASLGLVSAVFQRGASALPVLLVIWCAGVTLAIARILHERRSIDVLCERLRGAPRDIVRQVEALGLRAGVASRVRVLLGDSACGGPFVAGARHPVLVLPAVQLSHDEWNALILHELSHIRRRDYIVNEALRIWGAIFWFIPCVRLLQAWVAESREECCDADAARLSSSPVALALALMRIAEEQTHSAPALAATNGSLIARVNRMLNVSDEMKPHAASLLVPVVAALSIYACGLAFTFVAAPSVDSLAIAGAFANLVPSQLTQFRAVDPAGRFTITTLNGRVALATIAGVRVDRSALRIDGQRVTVESADGEPALSINFDPRSGIWWKARAPRISGGDRSDHASTRSTVY